MPRKKTQEEIIASFKEIHGDRYDYTLVKYTNARTPIDVKCKVHGVFNPTPDNHLKGSGCPVCSGRARHDNKGIIEKFKKTHGERFDYTNVNYINYTTPVEILCKVHGVFEQRPSDHIRYNGCPKCSERRRYSTDEIISEFRQIHGDRYDYSLVNFIKSETKVKIICKEHGEFEQVPYSHLGGAGCPACGGRPNYDNERIIVRFKEIHGDIYDYSHVEYINNRTPVKILCSLHGVFEQRPSDHLRGRRCPHCSSRPPYTTETVIEKFKSLYGDKYDYSLVEYISARKLVKVICRKHGIFKISPDNHSRGKGCPVCNRGWSKSKILEFINSIENYDLLQMDAVELQMIINQGKLPDALNVLVFADELNRDDTIRALKEHLQVQSGAEVEDAVKEVNNPEPEEVGADEVEESDITLSALTAKTDSNKEKELLALSDNFDDLHVLDNAIVASCDEETVEFLIQYKLRKLWNSVLNQAVDVEKLLNESGGSNFQLLKQHFFDEYAEVVALEPPQGYQFPHRLNAMQQLTVYRMLKHRRYGNWSGTGAGKTISFVVTSRAVDARLTVLVGLNSTIRQLSEAILEVYPDSRIYTGYREGQVFDRQQHNYLILNFDKFQQGYSEELFQDLTNRNQVDFIAIDEIHNVKQRTEEGESIRRGTLMRLIGRASEENPDLYVLGMSATPVINNLTEAKSLLEMVTGKAYYELKTSRTLSNALAVFKQMTLNGLRYLPKYQMEIRELDASTSPDLRIDGTHLLDQLLQVGNRSYLDAERLLLTEKLPAITPYLQKGTIIYSYFTEQMIRPIVEHLEGLGYRVGNYTGDESLEAREENKEAFLQGRLDILVGSRPVGTGVDGLQKVCRRMIVLSLPWTDAEYTQLKGRIYRQGSGFGEVEIVVPQVVIPVEGREWSWDRQRMNLIRNKKTLADAAVDGLIPSRNLPQPGTLFARSMEALKEWRDRLNEGELFTIDRKDLVFPLHPELVEKVSRSIGDFSEVNRKWSISRSSTTHQRLKEHPEDWYYYHTLYAEKRKGWEEVPYVEIAKMIKRKDFVVADLGCGENLLRREIPENRVLAFDHAAIDETVISCDISQLPMEEESVDVAVLSLALMGSNYEEYIREACRILRPMGFLFVAEPQGKWEGRQDELKQLLVQSGFEEPVVFRKSSRFLYLKCEKG